MKTEITRYLNDPKELEKIYRRDKASFKREFNIVYPSNKGNMLAEFWHERLNHDSEEINWGTPGELVFVIIISLIAGIIAKLPAFFSINEEFFYSRNIGFIVFPALSAYFVWKNRLSTSTIILIVSTILVCLVGINSFPDVKTSDTLTLSSIHLVLLLWSVLGVAFVGGIKNKDEKRIGYLKYSGDLVVMTTLILIAGGIMSGITVGLFELIGFDIKEIYFKYVAIFGLAAAPIVGTYLTQTNPALVGKVSPVIAKLFSPLVLVMLIIYLAAMLSSGKNPYNDRDFLIIFNALLIGVLALIFFSVAETSKSDQSKASNWVLFLLSVVTVLVNGITLSAILFRISEWGFTPNRTAVLGANVLILINLILVTLKLFRVVSKKEDIDGVGKIIAFFLPVYVIWSAVIVFILPLIFGFK